MLTTFYSENDLTVFPFLIPTSRHNSHWFLYNWFSMKKMLPEATVTKLPPDSAHDVMPYYDYCKTNNITPFIDLNRKYDGSTLSESNSVVLRLQQKAALHIACAMSLVPMQKSIEKMTILLY